MVARKVWSNVLKEIDVTPSLRNTVEDFEIDYVDWLVSLASLPIFAATSTGWLELVTLEMSLPVCD
jgi:diketogulonate reductase-like aldo/keto reductase